MAQQSLIDNNVVEDVVIDVRQSQKTGKDYSVLLVKFANGYETLQFLNSDQIYIINDLISKSK